MKRDEYLTRAHELARRGEDMPHSKLTDEDVREIRAEHVPYSHTHGAKAIARRRRLHVRTVQKVLTYASWRHVR